MRAILEAAGAVLAILFVASVALLFLGGFIYGVGMDQCQHAERPAVPVVVEK
jgi:hypothetical protein